MLPYKFQVLISELPDYDTEEAQRTPRKKYNRSQKAVSKPDGGGEDNNDGGDEKTLEAKYECSICKEKVRYGALKS